MNRLFMPSLTIAVAVFFAMPTAANGDFIDFNAASDLQKFKLRDDLNNNRPLIWSSAGGIGDSGSVHHKYLSESIYQPRSLDLLSAGDRIEVSLFFKANDVGVVPPQSFYQYMRLWLVSEPDKFFTHDNRIGVGFSTGASNDRFDLLYWSNNNVSGTGVDYPKNTLLPGHWYKMDAAFTEGGPNGVFKVTTTLDDFGLNGLAFLNRAVAETVNWKSTILSIDPTLYVSISGGSGMAVMDNVSIVPEPSTLALAALGTLGLLIAARRKR